MVASIAVIALGIVLALVVAVIVLTGLGIWFSKPREPRQPRQIQTFPSK